MAFIIGSGWGKQRLAQVVSPHFDLHLHHLCDLQLPLLLLLPPSAGGHDPTRARHPHRAHPRAVGAPPLPAAGQRLHPAVALPAVPALHAGPAARAAHLRGLPGALLPQGRLQGEGPLGHLRVQHALPGDGVHAVRPGVRTAEQRLLVGRLTILLFTHPQEPQ